MHYSEQFLRDACKSKQGMLVIQTPGQAVIDSKWIEELDEDVVVIDVDRFCTMSPQVAGHELFEALANAGEHVVLMLGAWSSLPSQTWLMMQAVLKPALVDDKLPRLMSWRTARLDQQFDFQGKVVLAAYDDRFFDASIKNRCLVCDYRDRQRATVADLIRKLQACPPDATLEDAQSEAIGDVWVNREQNRVIIEGEVDRPSVVAPGWEEIK